MLTRCFITLCIVFTMHLHKAFSEDVPDSVWEMKNNAPATRLDLDDMEYELDSLGDSRVPPLLLPRGKEHEYVRLPDKQGEFEVVSRKLVEESRRNGSSYDAAKYTKFILYTRANEGKRVEFSFDEIHQLPERFTFKTTVPTIFLIHGWLGNLESKVAEPMAKELLAKEDLNVIAVNWEEGASTLFYPTARYRVSSVGVYLAAVIDKLCVLGQLPQQIGLVGHSLGAHIAGLAGKNTLHKIGYIFGLDPAAPLFRFSKTEERLAADDARYVEVIHTDAKALGFYLNIGQVDIYPNGGSIQPGCVFVHGCSHVRAVEYYRESLTMQNLHAHRCADITTLNNECSLGDTFLGGYNLSKLLTKAQGIYYLATDSHEPFLKVLSF